jgi:hypothetical protein
MRALGPRDTVLAFLRRISLDWWSVMAAFAAAVLVSSGVLPHVPW